jgi:siroheme synthase
VIVDATRPGQQVWRGTLDQLASDAVTVDACGAGTIVIGDVVTIGLAAADLERPALVEKTHVSR